VKVTIVVSTLNAGGAERATVNMANHWAARGWKPTILTTSQRGRPVAYALDSRVTHRDLGWRRDPHDHELDLDSIDAILGQLDPGDPQCDPLFTDLMLMLMLRRGIVSTEPDAVISMIDIMNIRMLAATAGLPLRRVVSERCDPWRTDIRVYEPLRRRFYPRADRVITQTADAARYFERFGAKCHAIPNVVMAAPMSPSEPRNLGTSARGTRTIVAVARLVQFKRVNIIIRAFARIAHRHPQWRLDVWGEGPMRAFLQGVIEEVGGGERIRLRGHAHDVYEVMHGADLFAMTSSTEGFPNALCEAMACGVPAVVYDSGAGVREIVRHGVDGVLVQQDGVEAFANALDRIMSDDEERARLAARAPEVAERFSAETVMRRWEEVLT
jgi:GalNAc-alpha-(1->4)-GalNAc-alpha-(1->3)-diNAcBac-PP-undecaprenol alpha-1,4-N-acetyl-D-galactosaminyltransferase